MKNRLSYANLPPPPVEPRVSPRQGRGSGTMGFARELFPGAKADGDMTAALKRVDAAHSAGPTIERRISRDPSLDAGRPLLDAEASISESCIFRRPGENGNFGRPGRPPTPIGLGLPLPRPRQTIGQRRPSPNPFPESASARL